MKHNPEILQCKCLTKNHKSMLDVAINAEISEINRKIEEGEVEKEFISMAKRDIEEYNRLKDMINKVPNCKEIKKEIKGLKLHFH